jgi:hypothetical protein
MAKKNPVVHMETMTAMKMVKMLKIVPRKIRRWKKMTESFAVPNAKHWTKSNAQKI